MRRNCLRSPIIDLSHRLFPTGTKEYRDDRIAPNDARRFAASKLLTQHHRGLHPLRGQVRPTLWGRAGSTRPQTHPGVPALPRPAEEALLDGLQPDRMRTAFLLSPHAAQKLDDRTHSVPPPRSKV